MFHYQGIGCQKNNQNLSWSNLQSSSTNDFSYTSTVQVPHRLQYKRNLKTTLQLYEYYMTQTFENYLEFVIAVLLIGIMILVSSSEFTAIIPQVTAQAPSAGNMTTPMLDSARFHLKAADDLIMKGDTIQHFVK